MAERWSACRYCYEPAEWGEVCAECRRNTRLPAKLKRKATK
jgi:hypothetical protein